jgi:hypothetical protein
MSRNAQISFGDIAGRRLANGRSVGRRTDSQQAPDHRLRQVVVPLAGIEPALLAESDFESDASTSSAIGARDKADGADIKRVTAQGQCARAAQQASCVDGGAASG